MRAHVKVRLVLKAKSLNYGGSIQNGSYKSANIDVFCILFIKFGLENTHESQWEAKLMEKHTISLYNALKEFPTKFHQSFLHRVLNEFDRTKIYVIGTEKFENQNTDVKYEFLPNSPDTKEFFINYTPKNVHFVLNTAWAKEMVLVAAKQRQETPFRSIVLTEVALGFHVFIQGKLNVRDFTITLAQEIHSELHGWLLKIASTKKLTVYNKSDEEIVLVATNIPDTIEEIQIDSIVYDRVKMLSLVLTLFPLKTLHKIRRIGMNATLLEDLEHEIREYCYNLEAVILNYPNDAVPERIHRIVFEWGKAVIVETRESEAYQFEETYKTDPHLEVIQLQIEYGVATFLLKAKPNAELPQFNIPPHVIA